MKGPRPHGLLPSDVRRAREDAALDGDELCRELESLARKHWCVEGVSARR